jgi:hypothetical protein
MLNPSTVSPQRACGNRVAAGIYAETRLSPFGEPVESFILCPPKPIAIEDWGLSPRGARLIEIEGGWHIFDIVSKTDYSVADYVEETCAKGASRRLSSKLDFSKLSKASRLILIHEQAIIKNHSEYPQPPTVNCPLDLHLGQLDEMCAGLWWHDIPSENFQSPTDEIWRYRSIPGGVTYTAYARPEGVIPIYQHGIFMSLPVTNLTVITGRNPQEETRAIEAFQAASLGDIPVFMEEE